MKKVRKKPAPDVIDTLITELREDVDTLTRLMVEVQARIEKLEVVKPLTPYQSEEDEPQRPETE